MHHWTVAIDPELNLIVAFLFSSKPGEKEREKENKADQMSRWQHAALSKVALSIKIDREGEGRYFSGSPTAWHFRNAIVLFLSPPVVARKEHGCLDQGHLSWWRSKSFHVRQICGVNSLPWFWEGGQWVLKWHPALTFERPPCHTLSPDNLKWLWFGEGPVSFPSRVLESLWQPRLLRNIPSSKLWLFLLWFKEDLQTVQMKA